MFMRVYIHVYQLYQSMYVVCVHMHVFVCMCMYICHLYA